MRLFPFSDKSIQTPFVGEAIVKLYPEKFGEVHIFGTQDAMWDVLYYHCVTVNDEEKYLGNSALEHLPTEKPWPQSWN